MIKYVGYYDTADNASENREFSPAATNKMDYIVSVLNRLGHRVELVSVSRTLDRIGHRGRLKTLGGANTLRLFGTLPSGSRMRRLISRSCQSACLFAWLLLHTRRDEDVLVYHSVAYASLFAFARRVRRFRLILEVEEIYADVTGRRRHRSAENRVFNVADAFLFPTELLNQVLNKRGKPYAIVHGTYAVEEERGCSFGDGRIHVVYAGTFDPKKGGAAAAAAAKFLDHRYHVHIIGFGSERETAQLMTLMDSVSAATECRLTYDGLLSGDEYLDFLQSCSIGLSTQTPGAAFDETSFPSKVLSYLANGLRVVSIRLRALEESGVGDLLVYYETDSPEAIARAIQGVDLADPYGRARIRDLDLRFSGALHDILGRDRACTASRGGGMNERVRSTQGGGASDGSY